MQNKQWFLNRIDTEILRGNVTIFIKDREMAEKLFTLQEPKYTFSEVVKPRIFVGESICLACEGW